MILNMRIIINNIWMININHIWIININNIINSMMKINFKIHIIIIKVIIMISMTFLNNNNNMNKMIITIYLEIFDDNNYTCS